jgi:GGDEF domain-containing protein
LTAEVSWERSWGALAALHVEGLASAGGRLEPGAEAALRAVAGALRACFEGEADVFHVDASEFAIVAGVGATYDAAHIRLRIDEAFRTVRPAGYPDLRARTGVVTFEEIAEARAAFRLADWRMYAEKLERR